MSLREEYDIEMPVWRRSLRLAGGSRGTGRRAYSQIDLRFNRFSQGARRIFNDGAARSAGRSVAPPRDHWIMELDGWTNLATGENRRAGKASNLSAWTLREKLAEVRAGTAMSTIFTSSCRQSIGAWACLLAGISACSMATAFMLNRVSTRCRRPKTFGPCCRNATIRC